MPNPSNSDLVGEAAKELREWLGEVQEAETPEGRDFAWNAIERRFFELAQQLEQAEQLRREATVVMQFCDGYGNDFAASCPDAAQKFSILASRLDAALTTPDSATGQEEG